MKVLFVMLEFLMCALCTVICPVQGYCCSYVFYSCSSFVLTRELERVTNT